MNCFPIRAGQAERDLLTNSRNRGSRPIIEAIQADMPRTDAFRTGDLPVGAEIEGDSALEKRAARRGDGFRSGAGEQVPKARD